MFSLKTYVDIQNNSRGLLDVFVKKLFFDVQNNLGGLLDVFFSKSYVLTFKIN